MKLMKFTFAAIIALTFTSAYAFHSGGVAECEGCHSMHSPGFKNAQGVANGLGTNLLVGSDASSACLTCHQKTGDTGPNGYHISTDPANFVAGAPLQRTPGGDFAWLKVTFTHTDDAGATVTETGGGHHIAATDFGYTAETGTAPGGGTFNAANLGCNSCHDPHGKYRRLSDGTIATTGAPIWASGSYPGTNSEPKTGTNEAVGVYRLLSGGTRPAQAGGAVFPGVPAAKTPSTYNRSEAATQTRTAYGVATSTGHTTWGRWCATCHPNMHSTGHYVHPIDQALGSTLANYNAYVKSGDLTGSQTTSFLSLVPFFENTGDYTVLGTHAVNNNSQLGGPTDGDQVSCLSCHRAHASGFAEMLRFDNGYEFTVKNSAYVGTDNTTGTRAGLQTRGRTTLQWQAAYYDRPATVFASYQRVLCNKCHAKD